MWIFFFLYMFYHTRCYTSHWLSLTLKWLLVSILYSFVYLHRMLFMKYFVSCRYKRLYIKVFSLLQTFTPKHNSCTHLKTIYDSTILLIFLLYIIINTINLYHFSDVIMANTSVEIEAIQRYYFKFVLKTIKAAYKKETEYYLILLCKTCIHVLRVVNFPPK